MSNHRVTFTGIWNNTVTCQNVVCFDNPDGALTDAQMAAELRDNWLTLIAAGQVNTFAWRNISISQIGSNIAPFNLAINVQGVDGVDNLGGTQMTCVKWRFHTAFAGKRGRGRIYLPAFRSVYWSAGQLTATGITNITSRITAIKARYVGAGAPSPLVLIIHGRGPEAAGPLQVDDITLSLTPGCQRRRNLNVGI